MSVTIYYLSDPITGEVRYIGKTVTALKDRIKVHIHQSKKAKKPTHKEAWIKGLILNGLRPTIQIIEIANDASWKSREVYWIAKYRELGFKLTNLTIGGDGSHGIKHTQEWKDNNAKMMKGNKHSLGKKWTEEQREKMMKSRSKPWNKGLKGVVTMSDETKKKMSDSQKGHKRSGFKWSEEAKLKFAEGHKRGWETRNNNKKVA